MLKLNRGLTAAAVIAAITLLAAAAGEVAAGSKTENKCASKLGKGSGKLAKTSMKAVGKCRLAAIGGGSDVCPDAKGQAKIDKAAQKLVDASVKDCGSVCVFSNDIPCISRLTCPPRPTASLAGANENCSGEGGKAQFSLGNIGFPGALCEGLLGRELRVSADMGECVSVATSAAADDYISVVYGGLTSASTVGSDAQKCLGSIDKSMQKLVNTIQKGVAKCRDGIVQGKLDVLPSFCEEDAPKLADKIQKAVDKLAATLGKKCSDPMIAELDICGNGLGGTLTVADATTCLTAAARELADASKDEIRQHSEFSLIEAAYPSGARCGDNIINQVPSEAFRLGEECDGTADAACPGECLPPGDPFECTCGDVPRIRILDSFELTNSDAGWTGDAHEQGVADQSGFVMELSNCNCDAMSGAECTGNTTDSVCDVYAIGMPRCSSAYADGFDRLVDTDSCDAQGNGNLANEDADCAICSSLSANPGDFCTERGTGTCASGPSVGQPCRGSNDCAGGAACTGFVSDCQAQCYLLGDIDAGPQGGCTDQAGCAAGQVCLGGCDLSQVCHEIFDGGPLPVVNTSSGVCQTTKFFTDVTGTHDIVTGEKEYFMETRSQTYLGLDLSKPCPVCGGFCDDLSDDPVAVCLGRCSVSDDPCRFDTECPGGETCVGEGSPDCPGGNCVLRNICRSVSEGATTFNKRECSVDWQHFSFGSLSSECPPTNVLGGITGAGFEVPSNPRTHGTRVLPASLACDSPFQNFDCPCPIGGVSGLPTQPNKCAPACDSGGSFGQGCAGGGGQPGDGTRCVGGTEPGALCDEDADCDGGGTCSDNPTHCEGTGDPNLELAPCSTNVDCNAGTCVDACPGGRCVPLCLPQGDPLESGLCAAGPPLVHCLGVKDEGISCSIQDVGASCSATCSISGTPCTSIDGCPVGEICQGPCQAATGCEAGTNGVIGDGDDRPGADLCIAEDRHCFVHPISATGTPDPVNYIDVNAYCFTATNNFSVNSVSGFGGPGRNFHVGTTISNGIALIP